MAEKNGKGNSIPVSEPTNKNKQGSQAKVIANGAVKRLGSLKEEGEFFRRQGRSCKERIVPC